MKNIIVLLVVFGCYSCNKSENPQLTFIGEGQASKNGILWEGQINVSVLEDDKISISIKKLSEQGFVRNNLFFTGISKEVGIINIHTAEFGGLTPNTDNKPSSFYSTSLDDGDVTGDIFRLIEDHPDNYFEITSYDDRKGKMEGVFNLTFEFDDRYGRDPVDATEPDSIITFTNGSFSFKIED